MASQIKIAVVGKIGNGVFITDHTVADPDAVILCQCIADLNRGISRIALVFIRAF